MGSGKFLTSIPLVIAGVSIGILFLPGTTLSLAGEPSNPVPAPAVKVIAYYMHGRIRCPTCTKIEAYAQEVVEKGFPEEVKARRLEWKSVDFDQPANRHFITDYRLPAPSLVLVTLHNGRQVRWQLVPEVWELVDDKPKFTRFVQEKVQEVLTAASPTR